MAQAGCERRREPYWRLVVGRWRRSGRSVRAFCRAEGINEPQFYWWRRKLEQADRPIPAFLPVHVIGNLADQSASRSIEVVLANGRTLRVQPGFDAQTLMTLVEVLEAGGTSC